MDLNTIFDKRKAVVILAVLTFLTFGNVLTHGFVGDDEMTIVHNDFYKSLANIPFLFSKYYIAQSQDYFGDKTTYFSSGAVSYRPVFSVSFFVDYWLWKLFPFGWHLTNLLLHIVNTVLVYFLLLHLLKQGCTAFLAACLFGIHPMQAEAVAAISYRHDLLATFFALLAIFSYIKFSTGGKRSFLMLSSLAYLAGLFAKESVLGLPFVFICYDRISPKKNNSGQSCTSFWVNYFLFFAVAVFYLWVYIFCFPNSVMLTNHFLGGQFSTHVALIFKIFFFYIVGLFWPFAVKGVPPLYAPEITPMFDFAIFGGVCAFLVFLWGFLYFFRRDRILFFLMMWFFVFYVPVSNLIALANPMAHRFMYLPSIGFFAIWALGIKMLSVFFQRIFKSSMITQSLIIAYVAACMMIAFMVSFVWKSNAMLALGWVKEYPLDPKGYSILGMEYYRNADCKNAKKYFLKNIELGSQDPRSYYYSGVCSLESLDQQQYFYDKVIEMSPRYSLAYHALGKVYFEKHQYFQAIKLLKTAVAQRPMAASYKYMILSEIALKDKESADHIYQEAIKRFNKPDDLRVLKAAYDQAQ